MTISTTTLTPAAPVLVPYALAIPWVSVLRFRLRQPCLACVVFLLLRHDPLWLTDSPPYTQNPSFILPGLAFLTVQVYPFLCPPPLVSHVSYDINVPLAYIPMLLIIFKNPTSADPLFMPLPTGPPSMRSLTLYRCAHLRIILVMCWLSRFPLTPPGRAGGG